MSMRRIALVLLLLTCGGEFVAAQRAHCAISSDDVFFGNYTGSTIRVTGTLRVQCNPNADYAIALNAGTAPGATVTSRRMAGAVGGAVNFLSYELYSDPSYSSNWGNTPGTGWVTGTGNGGLQIFTVYAQLPGNQPQPPGTYSDTILVTISGRTFQTMVTRFVIEASLLTACSLSATDLAFGAYSGSQINATSTISVACADTTPYNVGLNAGTAAGATVTDRSMTGPDSTLLHYRLLSDPARSINWGDTVGLDTVAATGTGGVQTFTVYGQLPAGQYGPPGGYADTIVVTVTY